MKRNILDLIEQTVCRDIKAKERISRQAIWNRLASQYRTAINLILESLAYFGLWCLAFNAGWQVFSNHLLNHLGCVTVQHDSLDTRKLLLNLIRNCISDTVDRSLGAIV
jgi:hypothetical protein